MKYGKIMSLFAMILLCSMCMTSCAVGSMNSFVYYIFSDVRECQNLISNKHEDATIIIFDMPDDDEYIEDLKYEGFFGCNYTSSELSFEIFAYEFSDEESSKRYFKNAIGRKTDNGVDFCEERGMLSCTLVVIDGVNAYSVRTNSSEVEQMKAFLAQQFTRKLDFNDPDIFNPNA